jgi:hypothetical protein
MQLVSREQWIVTNSHEWDFYILENGAIKLLLLQEGKEFGVHELFTERDIQTVNIGNFFRIS